MTYELRAVSPTRLARIMAWVFGAVFLCIAAFMIPIFLLMPYPDDIEGQPPRSVFILFLVFYPLMGALWAWIGGQISARTYNFVARKIGGITFEAAKLEGAAS